MPGSGSLYRLVRPHHVPLGHQELRLHTFGFSPPALPDPFAFQLCLVADN